ncbi:nuclear transport factor 2 family protein [Noviherbaspirillum aridicola]|uniref:SnoaL-like domain-containing protein n=1 Tax=Noviherbaspirillum aridicola TaxID=2849687 RepID=A0ABQ4Q2P3_9BURK|nr:nuclear transport factor 2 family protein [Noviherbaspirillum aridicola]GIZ51369.1 hypothetical protein NCCP691_13830 [Noviherbaspirillum aridicola]
MDQQQIKSMADDFIHRLHRVEEGDPQAVDILVEMFAEDAELSNPVAERNGRAYRGRDAVERFWREYRHLFREVHSEFVDVTAGDHSAGLFWRSNGVDASGARLEYEGVSLLVFDDQGKIRRFRGYFDSNSLHHRPH